MTAFPNLQVPISADLLFNVRPLPQVLLNVSGISAFCEYTVCDYAVPSSLTQPAI